MRAPQHVVINLLVLLLVLRLCIVFEVQAFESPLHWFPRLSLTTTLKQPHGDRLVGGKAASSHSRCWSTSAKISEENSGRTPLKRKPNCYWNDIENVRHELAEFWKNLNVTSFPPDRPPIPSESLLNHFERNDLRGVIAKYGGREDLSHDLGGVEIIPGKWKDSVWGSRIVQEILRNESNGLQYDLPPLSPQVKRARRDTKDRTHMERETPRWSYKNKEVRRPMNYWSLPQVIENLYEHLDEVQRTHNRPQVWMPRAAEIRETGRDDLFHAIVRFGGAKEVAESAGLVQFHEWSYFEGQLDLMKALAMYLDEHHGGDKRFFPSCTEIKERGCMALYYAIQRYGGRKFLMSRFGMKVEGRSTKYQEMNFGPFSLDFAIDLLNFVRNDHLKRKAPLRPAVIPMPTEYILFQNDRQDLIDCIQQYGGHENVARRLGLAYFDIIPTKRNDISTLRW